MWDVSNQSLFKNQLSTNIETGYTSEIWTSAIALGACMDAPTLRSWITETLTVSVWEV